jgi:hypothetical protein
VPTKAEIQKQIDDLTASLDTADGDEEVWVKEGNREYRFTGARAGSIIAKFGDLFAPSDDKDAGGDDKDAGGDDKDSKPAGGYFGRKK